MESKSRYEVEELLDRNTTRPVNIHQVTVEGAVNARDSFVRTQIEPLLAQETSNLKAAVEQLDAAGQRLRSLGIFDTVRCQLDLATPFELDDSSGTRPLELDVLFSVTPAGKGGLKVVTTTTDEFVGGTLALSSNNVLGGAEFVEVRMSGGDPLNQAIATSFRAPVNGCDKLSAEFEGSWTSRLVPWASHTQTVRNAVARVLYKNSDVWNSKAELITSTRDVHDLKDSASDAVRLDSGESAKTSVAVSTQVDTRSGGNFPTQGIKAYSQAELAIPLLSKALGVQSDASFAKIASGFDLWKTLDPVKDRLIFNATANIGAIGGKSSIVDRFYLTSRDVLGYGSGQLGPKDCQDSIGGNGFYSASLALFGKLPRQVNLDGNLRYKLFFNGGMSVSGDGNSSDRLGPRLASVLSAPMATACGVGLVYRSPIAQLDVSYGFPLAHNGYGTKPGLQFGLTIGVE
ncbi:hypothetical protein TRVA0_050S00958 [Trichomonascus vanleenenianus]|uniref:uncharacterized protein n=1 Tax=Trichomonascus vanleenenianus TaxID=2268995 RepID=UPI003EC9EA77